MYPIVELGEELHDAPHAVMVGIQLHLHLRPVSAFSIESLLASMAVYYLSGKVEEEVVACTV